MVIALVVLLVLLLFLLPLGTGLFAIVPAAWTLPLASPTVVEAYEEGVAVYLREIEAETTPGEPLPEIDWRQVLIVEAVRRQQRLDQIDAEDAAELAGVFTQRHTREELRCTAVPPDADPDAPGDTLEPLDGDLPPPLYPPTDPTEDPSTAPSGCKTVVIIWYTVRPFDEVLTALDFTAEQREWAHEMLRSVSVTLP